MSTVTYNKDGVECPDNFKALAKRVDDKGGSAYYIRCMIHGFNRGFPVDPWNPSFSEKFLREDTGLSNPLSRYVSVDEECFNHYLKYLHSKNDLFYRTCLSFLPTER